MTINKRWYIEEAKEGCEKRVETDAYWWGN